MSLHAWIQSDRGEYVSLHDYGGGGKPLANFVLGFTDSCDANGVFRDDELHSWFAKLARATDRSFCHFSFIIEKATISSEGDYDQFDENDYEKYISQYGGGGTPEQFLRTIEHYRNAWTDINLLLDFTATMLKIFKEVNPEADESWYHPKDTVTDFEALERLLLDLSRVNVKHVRIAIG